MAQYTSRLNLKKPDGNDLIRRQDFNENWDKIDNGVSEIDNRVDAHINNQNNPHNVTYAQAGAAPLNHTHTKSQITDFTHTHQGTDITSTVPDADTVDGKHANGQPGNLPVLGSDGKLPLSNIPSGHGSGLDADSVDEKHANNQPNNLVVLDSNGFVPLSNLPLGEGGGLDADSVDGRHFEDLVGYNFVEQGYCLSGTRIYRQYQDFRVALIPLVDKFPQDIPYFGAPTITNVSGGSSQQGAVTYIAVQGISSDGKKGDWAQVVYEGYEPTSSSPITVSWEPIAGASYRVYVARSYGAWKLYATTSEPSCSITGISGTSTSLSYDIAPQHLKLEYVVHPDGFTPYFENYMLTAQEEQIIGISRTIGQTYQWQTQLEITAAAIQMRMVWTLNWPGFSGECTWGVRFRVRWKRSTDSDWLGVQTFEHQETWGSQWIGGSKSYLKNCTLNLQSLSRGVYIFEVYDIQEWKNNANFYFNPHNTVYIDEASYQTGQKVADFYGIYLIFAK